MLYEHRNIHVSYSLFVERKNIHMCVWFGGDENWFW